MVKVILQLYPTMRAETPEERAELRPIGRNVERYQEAISGLSDIIKAADDLGVWGVSTIEHHFHSEGYEVGPNPGVMQAYWAAITKKARVGALGYVMSAQNPIRVAEETAILDHLTKGRSFVGFARGYQSRWTNVLGQHLQSVATSSPSGITEEMKKTITESDLKEMHKADQINRDVFEEQVQMVLDAWTQESIEHKSDIWQVPYPHDDGIKWPMAATEWMGAHDEMGSDGMVKRISVVPAPYSDPHPPVFISSNASKETIEYAARHAFIPTYFSPGERAKDYGTTYQRLMAERGQNTAFGQNQAVVRWFQTGQNLDEARENIARYDGDIFEHFYQALNPFGHPRDPNRSIVDDIMDSGLWMAGTMNEVKDQFAAQWSELPAEYVILIFHYAQMPKDKVIESLGLFMEHVKPELDGLTDYSKSGAVA